jgi:hypothetical protein
MSTDTEVERFTVPLEGLGKTVGHIEVVGGAHPYLWLGGPDDRCIGVVSTEAMRALRDAMTAALRRARTYR